MSYDDVMKSSNDLVLAQAAAFKVAPLQAPEPIAKAATPTPAEIAQIVADAVSKALAEAFGGLKIPPPIVHITMPDKPAPVVQVNPELKMPPRESRTSVKRDGQGRIVETTTEERDL